MDLFDNPLGHRTNRLASQRLQYYRGCAIIDLRHLIFEADDVLGGRQLNERNLERLLTIFGIEGCGNFEPEHRVAAIIDPETLREALTHSNLSQGALLDPTNLPELSFEGNARLACVYGKHRLKAGEAFGESKWLVDLYLDDLPPEALTQLREESIKSLNFTDGEIYRTLRLYQILQNGAQEQKWWARFGSGGRRKDIRRLQRNELLLDGLDKLLPYTGLWEPLKCTHIERILGLKCSDIIYHYLCRIHEKWSRLFDEHSASLVDPASVRLVEGLMPEFSLEDRSRIIELIDSNRIFPLVSETQERKLLRDRVASTSGRLISLNTLIQDTLFLEGPAKALHRLCVPRFKGSLTKTMLRQWGLVGTGRPLEIQTAEHDFTISQTPENPFSICMLQLWLFCLRHFAKQYNYAMHHRKTFRWYTEMFSLTKLAIIAHRLGFSSNQINALRTINLDQKLAQGFVQSLCEEEFYRFEERSVQSMSHRVQSALHNLPKYKEAPSEMARFTTENADEAAKRSFNSPTPDQYKKQREHLFFHQVMAEDQPAAQYSTALGVTRDMLFCFFGKPLVQDVPSSRTANHPGYQQEIEFENQHDNSPTAPVENEYSPSLDRTASQPEPIQLINPEPVEDDIQSEPIDLDPHPSGTPDRDRTEATPPLAAGFEDPSCNCPLNQKNFISVHRKVAEILQLWYQSHNTELIVVFLFESRIYYKFSAHGGHTLRSTLQDLARDNYLLFINEYGLGAPDMNKAYDEALKERLVLIAKRDNPKHGKDEEGLISYDKLREYVWSYDIHTGKRKAHATDNRSRKRRDPRSGDENHPMMKG